MSRFHPSVSWKEPSPNQPQGYGSSDDPADSANEQWQSSVDQGQPSWNSPPGHRNYFLPLHYEPNYNYPLIVWLHSDGYNENQVDQVMPHISIRNYVATGIRGVRAVDSAGHRFDWHDSPAAIHAAHESVIQSVDEALRQFSVHPSRVVIAGYGSGGTMACRIAMRDPGRFAAVVTLGGRMPTGCHSMSNLADVRQRRLPMLWLCATGKPSFDDDQLNEDIRMAMMMRATVEVRQYPADDEMDTVVLSDINEWIMRCVVSDHQTITGDRWATRPTAYSAN